MESPELRINPENFDPCIQKTVVPHSFVSFQGGRSLCLLSLDPCTLQTNEN